jgi:hypothetical protein
MEASPTAGPTFSPLENQNDDRPMLRASPEQAFAKPDSRWTRSSRLSTITDSDGLLGATEVLGSLSGGGVRPTADTPLVVEADMRFMASDEYIGTDGRRHQGIFVFV